MKYRALEDLINILVKKAGYNLNEGVTLEDIDILTKRKGEIDRRKNELSSEISNESYVDKDEKSKDLEEKKYLEDTIDILKNQQDSGELTESEIKNLEEQVKFAELKMDAKDYLDNTSKELDEIKLESYSNELAKANAIIEDKRKAPSELGLEILDAFKQGKSFEEIEKTFNLLVKKASEATEKTLTEVNDSNIFELIENYNNEKNSTYKRIEKNEYSDEDVKKVLNEKSKYHTNRINTYKETMNAIDSRKKELDELVEDSKKLYFDTLEGRLLKEEELKKYTNNLYKSNNLAIYENDFNNYIDYLREEIIDDKFLEDKYNEDVLNYKNEIRNLELNNKNLNAIVLNEEKCLSIINKKLSRLNENNNEMVNDKINYLYINNRIENLTNEQQYYYVNVDVIKNEVINLWKKGGNASKLEEVNLPSNEEEVVEVPTESMYEEKAPSEEVVETAPKTEETPIVEETTPSENNETLEMPQAPVEVIESLE